METKKCRCGKRPDIYIQTDTRGKHRGLVECPECGAVVYGFVWCYDKDDAADDAVEEWNEQMPEPEEDEEDEDED